ncbi:hypothetical protein KJ611_04070 [Patescibacteria group bacterium]|nr:hypothetical protein [Patescibacteria group bacterium]MBU1705627.1 hypothetical protein [Patescibacteria group bacterium]
MRKEIQIYIFLTLIAGLLIGQRFDLGWAGGQGYDYSVPIQVVEAVGVVEVDRAGMVHQAATDDLIARGEIIRTDDASRVLLEIEGIHIGLDERTDMKVEVLANDQIQLKLMRGRIMVDRPATGRELSITTNQTQSKLTGGAASFINYDFKEIVSMIPFNNSIFIKIGDKEFITQKPVEIHEVEPFEIMETTFDLKQNAAADFYYWFEQAANLEKTLENSGVMAITVD